MLVTVIVDASYCQRTKAAGYGSYSISDRGRYRGGNAFKLDPDNSTAAETMAIVKGVQDSLIGGISKAGDHVIVQSDCLSAIQFLAGKAQNGGQINYVCDNFRKLRDKFLLSVELRHVRGHCNPEDGARFYVQNYCDRTAKRHMRKNRALRYGQQL